MNMRYRVSDGGGSRPIMIKVSPLDDYMRSYPTKTMAVEVYTRNSRELIELFADRCNRNMNRMRPSWLTDMLDAFPEPQTAAMIDANCGVSCSPYT